MRILIYIEPAIFRHDPLFLAPHVQGWALPMLQAHNSQGFTWSFASSAALCELARHHAPALPAFAIPSWSILSACGYRRDGYSLALFDPDAAQRAITGQAPLAPLAEQLQAINQAVQPELVIATAQNSLLPLAFPQARCLWMEQAPLPRLKKRGRIYLDPCGHQWGSVLEQAADRIRKLTIHLADQERAEALWQTMLAPEESRQTAAQQVRQAIRDRAGGRRVALLVLQPPDWLSWEGCLGAPITPDALLAQWAAALPEGWVGIPLYHPHSRLPAVLEASLAAEFSQLATLPPELSGNVAEWALPEADAVVAVSSSVAAHALISGKQVVVCGRSPLQAFAATSLDALADPAPSLTRQQRLALLAFLSHRYSLPLAALRDPNGPLPDHLRALAATPDPIAWLLDLSSWTPDRLALLG